MDAATHPGAGQFYSRLLVSRSECEEAGTAAALNLATLKLSYGIRSTLAFLLEEEFAHLSKGDRDETGLGVSTFQLKYRLFKRDLGPLNTWRTSILGGIAIPGSMDESSPEDASPQASVVSTAILGRHGLNGEVKWKEFDRETDRIAVNGSYLYRLSPSEYTATTRGAWYTMLETLNDFTPQGDFRLDVAFGILYEARRWACESSLRLPVEQDWTQDSNYTLTVGLRFLP
jgi:hypothetical protein